MSQAGLNNTSAGPVPPTVATTYVADDGSTSTPAANIENIFSTQSSDNNNNGIQTRASGNTHQIQLTNRFNQTTTTTNTTPFSIITLPMGAVAGTYFVEGRSTAYDLDDPSGASYSFRGAFLTDGATGTEIAVEYEDSFFQTPLTDATTTLSVSGNSIIVSVTGVGTDTINWRSYMTYQFVGVA